MASAPDFTRYICLFHSSDRAHAAVKALANAGIPQQAISTLGDRDTSGKPEQGDLADLGVPERDRKHLEDGLRHGGVLVSLEAPEDQSKTIEGIFHRYSADKIDEADLQVDSMDNSFADPALIAAALPIADTYAADTSVDEETIIPVAEESLVVGKRAVDRGGVRVFSRTVEEPVQQEVQLHGERVVLEYREVNRPVTDADLQDTPQEIELIETAEVPVVQKVARVVEEVHVGKQATDHNELVQDTVRHTEVEVESVDPAEPETTRRY